MNDIERAVWAAGRRVVSGLSVEEIRRRVQRREGAVLSRPPREWCLVVRAGDRRIGPMCAAMVPEDAADPLDREHPGKVLAHEVVIDGRLLRRLCGSVYLGESVSCAEAARRLGWGGMRCTIGGLRGS